MPDLPGDGTVTISRVAGRGRWTVSADGQPIARIDGAEAVPEPAAPTEALRVRGDDVVLRCHDDARLITFRQDR
ncbi:hypothetical protein [Amycolatopsis sp. H20-H5]|uniref:hypothetical protein n=1 Tax=Amycolatopsis sp. H20-H5 TaxID=3046309 RepID=UPI002DBD62AE|nr:hypothetical protein [Amycolatopsis sp. H20-H5]MEC3982662.1 hypothetical protein [Amycolatopsis sp. H20-H5]